MNERKQDAARWLRGKGALSNAATYRMTALGLLGFAAAVGQAFCAGLVLDDALGHASGWSRLDLLGLFALLAVARPGLGVASERAAFRTGVSARRRLRTEALGGLLAAGPALLRERHSGELVATVVDQVEALDAYFARWMPAARLAAIGPALVAAVVLAVDPVSGLILGGAGLLVPVGMAVAGLGTASASRQQFAAMGRLQARFLDRIRGIGTIVLHGRIDDEARGLALAADELRRRTMRVLRVAFLSSAALDLATALALVTLALRFAARLRVGEGDPGDALLVLLLVPEFFAPLRAFAASYQDRFQALGAAEALAALPEAPVAELPRDIRTVAARGVTVAFEDVGLSWDPAREPALDGVSFRVPAGETLVLAGPSGAGKSSVIEILLGFVRPDHGRVTLNGADLTTLVPRALSRLTAWIGQAPMLFATSIRENIRLARPEATDAQVDDAIRAARLESFVASLPEGVDTVVGEAGYGLSGGQAQRVAIARAFLKDAPLLLLDEPTAHLDPATEGEVLDSLRRLAVGRTVILASHSAAAHAFSGHGFAVRRLDLRGGQVVSARGAA